MSIYERRPQTEKVDKIEYLHSKEDMLLEKMKELETKISLLEDYNTMLEKKIIKAENAKSPSKALKKTNKKVSS